MKPLTFTVPGKPVGVNDAHSGQAGRPFRKRREMREFQELVACCGLKARKRAGWSTTLEPVAVELWIFFKDERPDTDGPVKPLLDALQASDPMSGRLGAGIVKNDRQVSDYHVHRRIDRARPRIEVEVALLGGEG